MKALDDQSDECTSCSTAKSSELIVCGWDEVFILDTSHPASTALEKVWSWKAEQHPEIPAEIRNRFGTTDECKPIDGGKKILISSSGGGVALVERKSQKTLFFGVVDNAHSADMLPNGRIAVAGSGEGDERGNCLTVFDGMVPNKPLCSFPLPYGHGVVWDEGRKTLWALSSADGVRAYRLKDWESSKPSLELTETYETPERGGHDLYPIPDTNCLSVSTGRHCWLFDCDKHSYRLHPVLGEAGDVKSISTNPATGQMAYVQADMGFWWTGKIHLFHPARVLDMGKEHLYKARWNSQVR